MPSSGAIQPIDFANLAGIGCVVMLIVPVDEFDKSLTWFPDGVHRFPRAKIADPEQGIVCSSLFLKAESSTDSIYA